MHAPVPARVLLRVLIIFATLAAVLALGRPALVSATPVCPSSAILYVNASVSGGSGDGSSWANASTTLSAALTTAANCPSVTQVWVAQGTYKPDTTGLTDARMATFQLKSGLAIYGGFTAGQGNLTDRDPNPATNGTTLSGDLNGDDGANFANNGDNSYHVVTGSGTGATAILDGVTVSGGNANGSDSSSAGGGMVNDGGSPTLTGVAFSGNRALDGGGMYSNGGSPTLTGVTFSGNGAFDGGGMYSNGGSPTLTNVTFSGNGARVDGGGMYNYNSSPTLTNVVFNGNFATYSGGGMFSMNSSSPTLTNVTFSGNGAAEGGGMFNRFSDSHPTIRNSILWGDTGGEIVNNNSLGNSTPAISYSIVQGSGGSGTGWNSSLGTDGGGNLDADPKFIAAPGNLRLGPGSPAINAGNNSDIPNGVTTDLDGNPRIIAVGTTVDMGAYEVQDTTPPDTSITSPTPANPTNSTSAGFTFTGNDTGGSGLARFECKLDSGSFAPCTSPQSYTGLADGSHTFQVRAVDNAGNTDPTPASVTWTVDTTPPDTSITPPTPANPTNSPSASFTFSASDPGGSGVARFECKLDSGSFATCTSPQSYTGLADGSHTFQVRAVDNAGNTAPTPASVTWTVDTTAPDTTITPPTPANPTNSPSAGFTFSGSDTGGSGVVRFECKLDSGSFATCTSPQSYSSLADGSHTFQVRAVDNAGNTDPTPASYTWTVDTVAPTINITTPANGATYFLAQVVTVSYTCADTGGSGVNTCTSTPANGSPIDTTSIGAKSFTVNATDNAGNANSVTVNYFVGYIVTYASPTLGPPSANNVYPTGSGPWMTTAKWKLTLPSGQQITTGAVAAARYASMTCGGTAPSYSDSLSMAGGFSGSNPRYDVFQSAWLFNWQLPGRNTCYVLYVKMGTGQVIPFLYNIH